MYVITVTNRKGGVGKTTFASHVAAGLATLGYNVLAVDTDSQGHLALMFGLEQANDLYDTLKPAVQNEQPKPLHEAIQYVPPDFYTTDPDEVRGNLFILRGWQKTAILSREMTETDTFAFMDTLEQAATLLENIGGLDFVLIDSQPSITLLDGAVYLATDAFLYVTELEKLSIAGLQDAMAQLERFSNMRQRLQKRPTRILGIVPNKMRVNTILHQENIAQLAQAFGLFSEGGYVLSPMRQLTVLNQAANANEILFRFEPKASATADMWSIITQIEGKVKQWQIVTA